MNFRKRPRLSNREIGILLMIILLTIMVLSILIGADIRLSALIGGGGGFFTPWLGVRAFVLEHANPYDASVVAQTQELVYGRQARPGENPYLLSMPFFLLPLYLPFALISDAATARGVWLLLSQAALLGTAFLSLAGTGWRPSRPVLAALSLIALFGFYPIIALIDCTPIIMVALAYAGMLWAYATERDEVAGAIAVLALFSWQTGLVFMLLFAWRVFHDARWRVVGGFAMTLTVLLIISFLAFPGWILPYLTAVLGMTRSSFGFTTATIFPRLIPEYGLRVAQGTSLLLIVLLIYEWAAGRQSDLRRFSWITCLALSAMPLLGFRSDLSNLVVLFPALSLIVAAAMSRGRTQAWLGLFFMGSAFLVPWLLVARLTSADATRTRDYLYLFYPIICIVGLYWTRWWFLRPRGTWLDEIRAARP